jgi:hypothetical protein
VWNHSRDERIAQIGVQGEHCATDPFGKGSDSIDWLATYIEIRETDLQETRHINKESIFYHEKCELPLN